MVAIFQGPRGERITPLSLVVTLDLEGLSLRADTEQGRMGGRGGMQRDKFLLISELLACTSASLWGVTAYLHLSHAWDCASDGGPKRKPASSTASPTSLTPF